MMRTTQMSFTSGELSPLLHARVDLARYATGLSELVNMIVLPQGGVTRRSGFENLGTRLDSHVKLIPFEYNTTDSVMLEFGNYAGRVWSGGSVVATFSTPYSYDEIGSLRYVQSGNVIFLAHRNHKPQKLVRHSMTSWTMSALEYSGGPWIDGAEWNSAAKMRLSGTSSRVMRVNVPSK